MYENFCILTVIPDCYCGPRWQEVMISSDNGLVSNRRQAIIWTTELPGLWTHKCVTWLRRVMEPPACVSNTMPAWLCTFSDDPKHFQMVYWGKHSYALTTDPIKIATGWDFDIKKKSVLCNGMGRMMIWYLWICPVAYHNHAFQGWKYSLMTIQKTTKKSPFSHWTTRAPFY